MPSFYKDGIGVNSYLKNSGGRPEGLGFIILLI